MFSSQGPKPSYSGGEGGVSVTPISYASVVKPVTTTTKTTGSSSITTAGTGSCVCVTDNNAGKTEQQHGNGFQKYGVSNTVWIVCLTLSFIKIIHF